MIRPVVGVRLSVTVALAPPPPPRLRHRRRLTTRALIPLLRRLRFYSVVAACPLTLHHLYLVALWQIDIEYCSSHSRRLVSYLIRLTLLTLTSHQPPFRPPSAPLLRSRTLGPVPQPRAGRLQPPPNSVGGC